MESGHFPTAVEEISIWRSANKTTLEEARRRFVQYVVLAAIASSPGLKSRIAFKGGNALQFIHGNSRSTLDLDFTADGDFPDDSAAITDLLNAAFQSTEGRFRVKARCQSIRRNPPGADKTLPTYNIKVGFQLPGDRYYQNFEERVGERKPFSEVVELEISLNDVLCETIPWWILPSAHSIRGCSSRIFLPRSFEHCFSKSCGTVPGPKMSSTLPPESVIVVTGLIAARFRHSWYASARPVESRRARVLMMTRCENEHRSDMKSRLSGNDQTHSVRRGLERRSTSGRGAEHPGMKPVNGGRS